MNYDILPNSNSEYPKLLVSNKVPGIIVYLREDTNYADAVFCIKTDKCGNIPKVLHSNYMSYVGRPINDRWGWRITSHHRWAAVSGQYQCWHISIGNVAEMYNYINEQLRSVETIYKHNRKHINDRK